ncbi:MAG TPA: hypothetical protein PKM44_09660, partial [Turneriella sp.]|nr:hypothetical protein [Turneriella sp.]
MQRWFVFPRESLLRHLSAREQALVYALALVPTLAPLLLVLSLLLWPSPLFAALAAGYFAYSYAVFLHIARAYLDAATPLHWSLLPEYHNKLIHPHIHPALEQKSLVAYLWKTLVWPGKRLTYDGKPVVLPPKAKDGDWVSELRVNANALDLGAEA